MMNDPGEQRRFSLAISETVIFSRVNTVRSENSDERCSENKEFTLAQCTKSHSQNVVAPLIRRRA